MQSTNWAPEHCEALRENLAKGMSYSEIAEAINAKFSTAYSRNATLSRARRMGLAGTDRPRATCCGLATAASAAARGSRGPSRWLPDGGAGRTAREGVPVRRPARRGVRRSHRHVAPDRVCHIAGRSAVGAEMAVRLGRAFNVTPQFGLNMQTNYDVWELERSQALRRIRPLKALKRLGRHAQP